MAEAAGTAADLRLQIIARGEEARVLRADGPRGEDAARAVVAELLKLKDQYKQLTAEGWFGWCQEQIRQVCGIVMPVATNILPIKCNVVTVFGSPISTGVPPTENPSEEQIDALLARYTKELRLLFEEHKGMHGIEGVDDQLFIT